MTGKIVAPASAASVILRRWMRLNGVSRTQRIKGRCSLRQTSAARSINCSAKPLAMRASVPILHGSTIIASVKYEPLATLAPMSALLWGWIFCDGRPMSLLTRSLRPATSNSSTITRSPLSETMRLTVPTRSSWSSASSRCLTKMDPLAPVTATVSVRRTGFSGAGMAAINRNTVPERSLGVAYAPSTANGNLAMRRSVLRVPMKSEAIKKLFEQVKKGKLSPDEAMQQLKHLPFEDLGFANVDHHRALRVGMAEVIFGPGKTPANLAAIFGRLAQHGNNVLATRVTPEQFLAVKRKFRKAEFHELGRAITLVQDETIRGKGKIVVVSAGTSDIPVAEEAVVTAQVMGNEVQHVYDVGVAGIHRLLAQRDALTGARVVVVCAGMEGALPSVVGGLVGVPVIAVPTSVGYGASFQGLSALLGMLNSCASNVSVVNIDNGFGAGYVASIINRLA